MKKKQLSNQNISDISDVFYACVNLENNSLTAYKKIHDENTNDIFI